MLIFLSFILIQGEQFYIFRGNYWDNSMYISQAIIIKENTFKEIINIKETIYDTQNIHFNSSYFHLGSGVILSRPTVGLLLAFFFKFNLINYFFLNNLFKIYIIILIFLSFYSLVGKLILKKIYLIASCFIISFWSLFVYDQEALSHLASIPIFISIITILLETGNKHFFEFKHNYYLFLLLNVCFFLIYPEFFAVYLFFLFFFILVKYKINVFVFNNYKNILFLVVIFIIITLPSFSANYLFLFEQTKNSLSSPPDFWGYYGTFLVGKDKDFLTINNITIIKTLIAADYKFFELIKLIFNIFVELEHYFIPINIIPSLFGMYYLTISKIQNGFDWLILFAVFLLNIYLIKIFLKNLKFFFSYNFNFTMIFKSFIYTFLLFAFVLSVNKNFWGIIKLYLFFSPLIFLFMIFSYKISDKGKFNINLLFFILIIIFPIYKFSEFNSGIGRYDSFPSIIKPDYKKKINWSINSSLFNNCKKIKIITDDQIIMRYLSIKLNFLNYKFNNGIYEKKYDNSNFSNKICSIKLFNSYFQVNER